MLGTTHTKGQIERALLADSKSRARSYSPPDVRIAHGVAPVSVPFAACVNYR